MDLPSSNNSNIDAGLLAVELTAYQAADASSADYGSLVLECLDSGGSVLASFTAQNFSTSASATWYFRSAKIAVPANSRKIRIGTTNTRFAGTALDSYWDDFSYSLTTNLTLWTNGLSIGNRTSIITATATNITAGASTPNALLDGSQANSYWWTNATGDGTGWLAFDFGTAKIVDGFRLYASTTASHGVWRLEGSNDLSGWTQIGADFTLTAAPVVSVLFDGGGIYYFTNSTAYRYYRLRHMSGSRSQTPFIREIEFRVN